MMRWVLAALGFVYGRVWGAIGGYLVGKMIDDSMQRKSLQRGQARLREDLIEGMLTLAMAVARADGRIDRAEVRRVRQFFEQSLGLRGEAVEWLRDALKAEARNPGDWRRTAAQLSRQLGPLDRMVLFRLLLEVAAADGNVSAEERAVIEEVGRIWGLGGAPFNSWQQQREQGRGRAWALGVLELTEPASEAEIQRAYRRLVREKHPDRFAHLGEAFQKQAHEQFVEIQEAYRILTS
ncbi:MAG: hypothetical protein D6761_08185 [Candidatus Dadabacteria bacterium]|nr:MAG: hypothetical protein D6761_08185 [Candidatus Dadabacteria bacterium]